VIATTLTLIFGTAMTSTNSVWAANIDCPNRSTGDINCFGTQGDDRMAGTANEDSMRALNGDDTMFGFARNDLMFGEGGDDTMSGGSGDDRMFGDAGNDKINGDSGDDTIFGFPGADIIKGSSGNDKIFHYVGSTSLVTNPDFDKDIIDCGSGNDEVWINVSVDHDTAVNCETVHAG